MAESYIPVSPVRVLTRADRLLARPIASQMGPFAAIADFLRAADTANLEMWGRTSSIPGAGSSCCLIHVLNMYKPQGMMRYGWRKQQEERRSKQVQRDVVLQL